MSLIEKQTFLPGCNKHQTLQEQNSERNNTCSCTSVQVEIIKIQAFVP